MRHPPTDPAFPNGSGQLGPIGLTKREHFAALILAGMYANSAISLESPCLDMALLAITQADSLLKVLGIQQEPLITHDDLALDELRAECYSGEALSSETASDQLAALAR